MAGTIGTNVLGDEQALSDLTQALLNDIKRLLEHHWSTKKDRLLNEMYDYIKGGGNCSFKFVPRQLAEKIEIALQDKNIPYHTIYGANGDIAFLVKEKDKYKFFDIQKEVFMSSADYYAQIKGSEILKTSKGYSSNEKNKIIRLSFESTNAFEYVKQQLFNNDIVSGALDFSQVEKNLDNRNIKGQIYISSEDYFNESGKDISKVELEHAAFRSLKDSNQPEYQKYFDNKIKKLEYDNKQLKDFAKLALDGEKAVLGDVTKRSNSYLEIIDKTVYFVARQNGVFTPHEVGNIEHLNLQETISLCSRYAQQIENMHVYSEKDDNYDYTDWIKRRDKQILDINTIQKLIEQSGREYDFELNEKVKSEFNEVTNMLQNINKEASAYVEMNYKNASSFEKYHKRQRAIEEALKNPENIYVKYFIENTSLLLDQEEKEKMILNIFNHYKNKHEEDDFEMILDELDNSKSLMSEVLNDEAKIEKAETTEKENNGNKKETYNPKKQEDDRENKDNKDEERDTDENDRAKDV